VARKKRKRRRKRRRKRTRTRKRRVFFDGGQRTVGPTTLGRWT